MVLCPDAAAPRRSGGRPFRHQRRAAFETHNGRSALAAGTALRAPHLPFAMPAGIGSIGCRPWKNAFSEDGGPTSAVRLWQVCE